MPSRTWNSERKSKNHGNGIELVRMNIQRIMQLCKDKITSSVHRMIQLAKKEREKKIIL